MARYSTCGSQTDIKLRGSEQFNAYGGLCLAVLHAASGINLREHIGGALLRDVSGVFQSPKSKTRFYSSRLGS